MAKVLVSKQYTVSANTTETQVAYTVTPGKKLKLNLVKIWFPTGVNSELRVKILHGNMQIAPTEGYAVGDNIELEYRPEVEYGSEEYVKVWLQNTNSTESRDVQITLEGEES